MIDKRFPQWEIDVEKGTVYSLRLKRNIGTNGRYSNVGGIGIHRIIWMVANQSEIPEGYDIHHIDHNPSNNSIYNLELIDEKTHISEHKKGKKHSEETRNKISKSKIGVYNNPKKSKQVAQYTLDGELVKVWCGTAECGRNGFNQGHVSECCQGKRNTHKEFKWKYYEK